MLQTARLAAERRSWVEAFEAYTTVDRGQPLGPEDLDQLAKAAWWTGRPNDSIAAHERAYAKYVERGDVEQAAFVALTLRREHTVKLDTSSANGWLARAVRLLCFKARKNEIRSGLAGSPVLETVIVTCRVSPCARSKGIRIRWPLISTGTEKPNAVRRVSPSNPR